jgi:hypothetical protein
VFELSEEEKSFGAQRAALCLDQQIADYRSRACPLARSLVCPSSRERTLAALVALIRWRQPECVLRELGRKGRRAAICSEVRSVVEHDGNPRIGRFRRKREVTGAEERVIDRARNPLVNASPLLSQVLVKH